MKREFENYKHAITWIAINAISNWHLQLLKSELSENYETTGKYFVYTIIWN